MASITTRDLAKLSCEDLSQLQRILLLMGKSDAAAKVAEVAMKKGCTVSGSQMTGELIL